MQCKLDYGECSEKLVVEYLVSAFSELSRLCDCDYTVAMSAIDLK
jgi:hypothetical protein